MPGNDVFDYWGYDSDADQHTNNYGDESSGINAGRDFLFNDGAGGSWNSWTGSASPYQNIVERKLVDGYPVLAVRPEGATAYQSLAYLFDESEFTGKDVYSDAKGLLQVGTDTTYVQTGKDGESYSANYDGYYYYDSKLNYATLAGNPAQPDTFGNTFTLYDGWSVRGANPVEGVYQHESTKSGQFFPFDPLPAEGQYANWRAQNSTLGSNTVDGLNTYNVEGNIGLNHHFGMTMTTRFYHQNNGHVSSADGAEAVTYEFSGDDDVWIYIDDVLVGDLGGIHDKASVKIDFSTGEVIINGDAPAVDNDVFLSFYERTEAGVSSWETADLRMFLYDGGKKVQFWKLDKDESVATFYRSNEDAGKEVTDTSIVWNQTGAVYKTTIREQFEAAGVSTDGFSGDTFANNTYHTLKFFYLERGGADSNMMLKFNLVTVPDTTLTKVDQDREPVAGVQFNLYPGDLAVDRNALQADGSLLVDGNTIPPIATGTTDGTGKLTFYKADKEDEVLSLDEIWKNDLAELVDGRRNLTLLETDTPNGYRPVGATHLYLQNIGTEATPVVVIQVDEESRWETGSSAQGKVQILTPEVIYYNDGQASANLSATDGGGALVGRMFAAVMKRQHKNPDPALDTWSLITGDPINGWVSYGEFQMGAGTQAIDGILAGIQEAVNKGDTVLSWFGLDTGANWSATVGNLPGDITQYYIEGVDTGNQSDAEYAIAYYYTTADDISEANSGNTFRVPSGTDNSFQTAFAADLYVSNVKSQLSVMKVDSANYDTRLNGAEFALYRWDGGAAEGGSMSINEGSVPANTDNIKYYDLGDGRYLAVPSTVEAYDTAVTTEAKDNPDLHLDGTATFPTAAAKSGAATGGALGNGLLVDGTYYLVETAAPTQDGIRYAASRKAVKVVVNIDGVYADAGTETDEVSVLLGVGQLLSSAEQFANGQVDNTTLYDIKLATRAVTVTPHDGQVGYYPNSDDATKEYDTVTVGDVTSAYDLHLYYVGHDPTEPTHLDYVIAEDPDGNPIKPDGMTWDIPAYWVSSGWSSIAIRQCMDTDHGVDNNANKTDLGETDITGLFSGTVTVVMENERYGLELNLEKVTMDGTDFANTGTAMTDAARLAGATFRLSRNAGGVTEYYNGTTGKWVSDSTAVVSVDADGKVTLPGLTAGTYTLEELKAPDGYKLASTALTFTVSDSNQITSFAGSVGSFNLDIAHVSDVWRLSALTANPATGNYEGTLYVNNTPGTILPPTGGEGVQLYWAAGGTLVLAAALAFALERRKRQA